MYVDHSDKSTYKLHDIVTKKMLFIEAILINSIQFR